MPSIKFSEVNLISKGESDMTVPVDQVKVLHEAGLFSSAKLLVSQLCSCSLEDRKIFFDDFISKF